MKKLITLLMIVLLLAGCSGRKGDDSPTAATPKQPAVKPAAEDPSEKLVSPHSKYTDVLSFHGQRESHFSPL